MAKKYQVFISSTFDDLKEHRDAVVKAVLQLGHLPVGMEMFNAGDQTQWETIKSYIDSSDYYLVILAHRYGTKGKGKKGLSYTETEYDYAGKQGIPRLGFVIDKNAAWPASHVEADAKKELDAFKSKVGKARVIKFWDTTDSLAYHVALSLANEITINPRTGWVRATEAASPQVAEELARLSKENRELTKKLQTQPADDATVLLGIMDSMMFPFPINGENIGVALRDFFLAAVQTQTEPYTQYIYNRLLSEKSGKGVDKDEVPSSLAPANAGLDALTLMGILDVKRYRDGTAHWYLTEKGRVLYTRLLSQTQNSDKA